MPRAAVDTGMELEYDTFGSPSDPALLLVMGFTAQMTAWPDAFCAGLAAGGFHVIRFDNRDCGLSSKLDGRRVDLGPVLMAAMADQPAPDVPYTLSDMANDAIGLLQRLGIGQAHIVGASMGGMIAQTIAIEHRDRCLSLTSIMSQPGDFEVGQPTPEAAAVILRPPVGTRDEYIDSSVGWMTWHSKKYRDAESTRRVAAENFDRSFYPEGAERQMAAIYASGRRAAKLAELRLPTLVIHGRDDTLIDPSGGFRTAELIDGAHLLLVADMGHDLPEPLWPLLTDAIVSHARHAQQDAAHG
jgi:pimeloyl-ACP methyl ester carboxylesterase